MESGREHREVVSEGLIMAKKEQTACPLQLSHCFERSCRYFLEGKCEYHRIKAMEKKRETAAASRRVSDGRESVRMKG